MKSQSGFQLRFPHAWDDELNGFLRRVGFLGKTEFVYIDRSAANKGLANKIVHFFSKLPVHHDTGKLVQFPRLDERGNLEQFIKRIETSWHNHESL